jgi:hypothetical protein
MAALQLHIVNSRMTIVKLILIVILYFPFLSIRSFLVSRCFSCPLKVVPKPVSTIISVKLVTIGSIL